MNEPERPSEKRHRPPRPSFERRTHTCPPEMSEARYSARVTPLASRRRKNSPGQYSMNVNGGPPPARKAVKRLREQQQQSVR